MRQAWRELLFADEDLAAKNDRDPVAPAQRSQEALEKIAERTREDGSPVHSFHTLLQDLATLVRNTCLTRGAKTASPAFQILTTPTDTQHRALQLLQQITVWPLSSQLVFPQLPERQRIFSRAGEQLQVSLEQALAHSLSPTS